MLLAGMQGPPVLCSGRAVQKMDSYVSEILLADPMHRNMPLYQLQKIFKHLNTASQHLFRFLLGVKIGYFCEAASLYGQVNGFFSKVLAQAVCTN